MKIEFGQELQTIDGNPLEIDKKSITLRFATVEALLTPKQDDSGNQKAENYALAMKIHQSNGEIDLQIEEVAKIKKLIGENMSPLVVGQCWDILDPKENP